MCKFTKFCTKFITECIDYAYLPSLVTHDSLPHKALHLPSSDSVIGASLSKPHTSELVELSCVCVIRFGTCSNS